MESSFSLRVVSPISSCHITETKQDFVPTMPRVEKSQKCRSIECYSDNFSSLMKGQVVFQLLCTAEGTSSFFKTAD